MPVGILWVVIGFALAESWNIGRDAGQVVATTNSVISPLFFLCLASCILYLLVKVTTALESSSQFKPILGKNRLQLPLFGAIGLLANVYIFDGEYLVGYLELVGSEKIQVITILIITFDLVVGFKSRVVRNNESLLFLDDGEIRSRKDDLLGMSESASTFAESVFNEGDPRSLVFGIDAPWGIGKTSFLNLCEEHWREQYDDRLIVYRFSPLDHSSDTDLVKIFLTGLSNQIQKRAYVPQLDWLIKRFSSFLKTGSFSFFSYDLPTNLFSVSENQVIEGVQEIINQINKKVIVIVDDLDRIDFDETREILFVIRKGFSIDGISYVVAYDSNALRSRSEEGNLAEYLEKFINVRVSLFTKRRELISFLSEEFFNSNIIRPYDLAGMRDIVAGFTSLLSSNQTAQYQNLLGDLRKIKRLVNVVTMSGLDRLSLKRADIEPIALAKLILLYVNFPSTFRTIYDSETDGRYGLVSLENQMENGERSYKNTCRYHKFRKLLTREEKFLLDELFHERLAVESEFSTDPVNFDTLVSINDEYGIRRNLERYLNFIVEGLEPDPVTQTAFYREQFQLVEKGQDPKDVFNEELLTNSEEAQQQMWNHILSELHKLDRRTGLAYMQYLLSMMPSFSLLETEGFRNKLRASAPVFLTKFLDRFGWDFENATNSDDKAIAEILEFVFGNDGVLSQFNIADVRQLNDLMMFRLYCSADRGGDNWNLSAALTLASRDVAIREGAVQSIAIEGLRKLSQEIFRRFHEEYIARKRSLAVDIHQLTSAEIALARTGEEEITQTELQKTKNTLLSFIVYQLTNKDIRSGIGCGYYDLESDSDGQGIRDAMNDYLLDICFDPNDSQR
ncbi:MAG: P-loop NTPase fold protein, partial [Pseudomonadales bacterium]